MTLLSDPTMHLPSLSLHSCALLIGLSPTRLAAIAVMEGETLL